MNIKSIWNAFFPIPDPTAGVSFWNTNIVNYIMIYPKEYNVSDFMTYTNVLTFLISLLIIIIISIKFSSKPTVLITFLFNTIIYLVFLKLLKVYFLRYQGLLFIIFMYSYFLYSNSEENYKISHFKKITDFSKTKSVTNLGKLFTPVLYIILIAQVYSAVYALSKDINFKFTLSQDAAKYIMDNNLQVTHTMVGYIDHTIESIAAHVQTKIFFPQSNSFSFYHEAFNKDRKTEMPIKEVFALCRKITEEQNKKVLLILDLPLSRQFINNTTLSGKSSIKLIKAFYGEIIQPDEQYFLYEVEKI
jgi:hypothetical protein